MEYGTETAVGIQPVLAVRHQFHFWNAPEAISLTKELRRSKPIDWELPGHGEKCDIDGWMHKACPSGKHFVRFKRSCFKSRCPNHWRDWMNRAAGRVVRRVKAYVRHRETHGWRSIVQHIVVSPAHGEWWATVPYGTNLKESIWEHVRACLREVGVKGGAIVYHHARIPTKFNDRFDIDSDSPHFHVLAFGKVSPDAVRSLCDRTGTVIKALGRPKSLMSVCRYILSHASVPFNPALQQSTYHTVTWFGCVSYSKFRVPPGMDDEMLYCPGCKEAFPWHDWYVLEWNCDKPPPEAKWGPLQPDQWAAVTLDRTGNRDQWERMRDFI